MIPALLPPATWTLDPTWGDEAADGASDIRFRSIINVVEFRVFFFGVITIRSEKMFKARFTFEQFYLTLDKPAKKLVLHGALLHDD